MKACVLSAGGLCSSILNRSWEVLCSIHHQDGASGHLSRGPEQWVLQLHLYSPQVKGASPNLSGGPRQVRPMPRAQLSNSIVLFTLFFFQGLAFY